MDELRDENIGKVLLEDGFESDITDSEEKWLCNDSEDEFSSDDADGNDNVSSNVHGDVWTTWSDSAKFREIPFCLSPGYQPPRINSPTTPLDFFCLFFTEDLIDSLVKETNRYGDEKVRKNMPFTRRSIWTSWTHVTSTELKAFLGVLLNMALNEKPEIQDYFSENWLDHQPFFSEVFSRERFSQIFWNLHVDVPNKDTPANSVSSNSRKIKNIIYYLQERFQKFYVPIKHISVDESTVGFKGRVSFKTYNKDKPRKWGIKIFVLSDSKNGYAYVLEPYFGAKTTSNLIRPDLPFTTRIVVHLVTKYLNSPGGGNGAHIFTDRYYTSPQLALELLDLGVHLTGTVMTTRKGFPDALKPKNLKNLKKGEIVSMKTTKMSAIAWKDKVLVCILSTFYNNEKKAVIRKTKVDGEWIDTVVEKPVAICEYNTYMGGVDMTDHYATSYAFGRKTRKWWRKLFFWLLDVTITNAFLLYRQAFPEENIRAKIFRKKLILQLVGDWRQKRTKSVKRSFSDSILDECRLNGKFHSLYSKSGNRDCRVCSNRKHERKTTNFYCKSCPGEPAMHHGDCFEKFHTKKDFKS